MEMSFRNVARDIDASPAKLLTLFAQSSNARSWVIPLSIVIASYFVLPGIWCGPLASPPSYQAVTSVVRFSAPHLLNPATYWPSHFTLNRNPRYGSNRVLLTVNRAICVPLPSPGRLPGSLADLD